MGWGINKRAAIMREQVNSEKLRRFLDNNLNVMRWRAIGYGDEPPI